MTKAPASKANDAAPDIGTPEAGERRSELIVRLAGMVISVMMNPYVCVWKVIVSVLLATSGLLGWHRAVVGSETRKECHGAVVRMEGPEGGSRRAYSWK